MTVQDQWEILQEMQGEGFNVCTCGNCGQVVLFNEQAKQEPITCPYCKHEQGYSDMPDWLYEGSPDLEIDN